ncbi:hypothetical protein H0H92_004106 [Tricholoma furcatifolium]|nr:hypothetical protein H0H92_004106 [Tricholoma furcatifolium]
MPSVTDAGAGDPGLSLLDPAVTALITRLRPILCDNEQEDARKRLMRKPPSEAQSLLDIFQKAPIQSISSRTGLYPTCYELKDVVPLDENPVGGGGFADVFCGIYKDQKVCLKALRLRPNSEINQNRLLKELAREALLWGQLVHPNVLMFYGLFRFKNRMCMVSPWMENGDVNLYLLKHPAAARLQLVRPFWLKLEWIHHLTNAVTAGSRRGEWAFENVLVDSTGRAHLADFGISSASNSEIVAWTTLGGGKGGTAHYQAPELAPGDEDDDEGVIRRNTLATDIYAWACVCFEIFVGKPPFHKINSSLILWRVSKGHRPQYPSPSDKPWTEWGLTGDIWAWIERCWHQDPRERPSAAEVTQYLSLLLSTDARQAPKTTLILPSQFRSQMSHGFQATDVETLDRILCSVEVDPSTEVSNLIEDNEATESPMPPTEIIEGLTRNIRKLPPAKPFHLTMNNPKDKDNNTDQFVANGRQGDLVLREVAASEHSRRPGPEGPTIALLASKLKLTLAAVDAYKRLLHLESSDAQTVLDTFQKLLDLSSLDVLFRRNVLVAMQRISTRTGLWPTFYHMEKVVLEEQQPVTSGGFADIYRAAFRSQRVALKVLRIYPDRYPEIWKILAKEAILWSQLTHPNVLPFYGLFRFGNQMSMVSPWMDDGGIMIYLRNRPSIPRLPLAADAANGLSYLHDLGIIYGELEGANVLIDPAGRARLTDFGLSSAADSNIISWTSQSNGLSRGGTTTRWMAPELLNYNIDDEDMAYNTTASDVYAWGCIFTGQVPFADISWEIRVIHSVCAGYRPTRPPGSGPPWTEWGLTEAIWSLMENCWRQDPKKRPSAAEIVQSLTPLLPESDTRPPTSSEISPVAFRRSMGATLSTDDVEALDRVLKKAGIEFTTKEANQIGLKLRSSEQLGDDPDEMPTPEVEEKNVRSDQLLENSRETDIIIVTIGPTGSGKSKFISYLAGQVIGLAEQRTESTTTQIQHLIISSSD